LHRRKSTRGFVPTAWHERNDRDSPDEGCDRECSPESAEPLVPESKKQHHARRPFPCTEEPTGSSVTKDGIHPGNKRAVFKKRDERLHFVIEPLLVAEEQEKHHHGCANQVVIEVPREKARLKHDVAYCVHGLLAWLQAAVHDDELRNVIDTLTAL